MVDSSTNTTSATVKPTIKKRPFSGLETILAIVCGLSLGLFVLSLLVGAQADLTVRIVMLAVAVVTGIVLIFLRLKK